MVSLAWTNDGQFLALGLYDGHISIRSRVGEEVSVIQRDAPVWTLSWSPARYISSCCLITGGSADALADALVDFTDGLTARAAAAGAAYVCTLFVACCAA